jgi:hypothetical protein
MKNPITRNIIIAGSFQYFGSYTAQYYIPAFYQKVFTNYRNQFAFLNAIALFVFGFISNISGGLISDIFSKKNDSILS